MPRAMTIADEQAGAAPFRQASESVSNPPHPLSVPFVLETAESPRAFADLWPDLASLAGRPQVRAYPFQCRDHLEIWLDTIGRACSVRPLFVKVTAAEGAPLMLLPLGIRRQLGVRILTFLDCGVADYNAPVLFRAAAGLSSREVRAVWRSVLSTTQDFDIALLEKIPELVGDFKNPFFALGTQRWPQSGHVVALSGDITKLQSNDQRRDGARKRRRLEEQGAVAFRIAEEPQEIDDVFDVFLRQKSAHYRETLDTEGFDVPGQIAYYHTLARRLSGRGAHLFYLSVSGEIVATVWCLASGRRLYYMMPAYARGQWRKYSPGRLLLEDLVVWAAENGFEVLDFGIGNEEYKQRWSASELSLSGAGFPTTPRGYVYRAAAATREALRNRLPPPVRRFVKRILPVGNQRAR